MKTTINNEIFVGKLLQLSFNFQIIVFWKKKSLSKKFKKKGRKEGDRIHVKY